MYFCSNLLFLLLLLPAALPVSTPRQLPLQSEFDSFSLRSSNSLVLLYRSQHISSLRSYSFTETQTLSISEPNLAVSVSFGAFTWSVFLTRSQPSWMSSIHILLWKFLPLPF